MPPFPGEERLVTVFADIHYYFAQPAVRPLIHRFDKSSYFYIYYNSTRHTSRIEVANNPGTPDQDAFNGYLDTCRFVNSYTFPTRLSIVVDDASPTSPTSPKTGRDPDEWRLTSADPRDANKTKYRLHTLDVYFWAQDDAKLVIESLKKLLHPSQLELDELEPEPELEPQHNQHSATAGVMSPVVQNLENMAVHDPAYSHQQNQRSAHNSASSGMPPPPSGIPLQSRAIHSPSPAISDLSSTQRHGSVQPTPPPPSQNFVPMAYNPSAPPAPEKIAHREKTPPPDDGTDGNGLNQAIRQDHNPNVAYHPGQGVQYGSHGSFSSPPPQSSSLSFGAPPTSTSAAPSFGPGAMSTVSPLPQHSHNHSTAAEHYVPQQPLGSPGGPVVTPGSQFLNSLPSGGGRPLQHVQPQYADYLSQGAAGSAGPTTLAHSQSAGPAQAPHQPPLGGYSSYSYGQPGVDSPHQSNPYDVHQQLYRPTEEEANAHSHKHKKSSSKSDRKPSTFDSGAARVEKGVGRLFKKIEKKF